MFGLCWHKWKFVYQEYPDKFLGEVVRNRFVRFRICEKCGKSQEAMPTYGGIFWDTLSDARAEILKRKIVDKGPYYLLEDSA